MTVRTTCVICVGNQPVRQRLQTMRSLEIAHIVLSSVDICNVMEWNGALPGGLDWNGKTERDRLQTNMTHFSHTISFY